MKPNTFWFYYNYMAEKVEIYLIVKLFRFESGIAIAKFLTYHVSINHQITLLTVIRGN